MLRLIVVSFITLTTLLNLSCFNNSDKTPSDRSQVIGEIKLYTFSSSNEYLLSDAQPFILPPSTSVKDALDSLGRDLAQNYFSKTYTNEVTDIHFKVIRIDEISTPSKPLHIAVVNMVDTNEDAMGCFFQGSTGGQATFCMLAATFMQPHLEPPLLDGLVILYNGKLLPELDHINLSGILTPRLVRFVVKRAIYGIKMKPVISGQDWVKMPKHKL